jgi:putative flippase GtrA
MPIHTFRYAACGGGNTVLGLLMYYISYTFIFRERVFDIGLYAFKPHIAANIFIFCINFPVGFLLMKYVVFLESTLKGKVQLFRYFSVFVFTFFLDSLLLKLLVEYLHLYAILAKIIVTAVVIVTSYLLQRHFSFKTESTEVD